MSQDRPLFRTVHDLALAARISRAAALRALPLVGTLRGHVLRGGERVWSCSCGGTSNAPCAEMSEFFGEARKGRVPRAVVLADPGFELELELTRAERRALTRIWRRTPGRRNRRKQGIAARTMSALRAKGMLSRWGLATRAGMKRAAPRRTWPNL